MKYLLLFLFALTTSTALAQQRHDMVMMVDSVPREFIVVRPSGAVPAGGYPIVFMFHGSSGNGGQFYNISGWKEKGEEEKFITVFPSSLEYCLLDSGRPQHRTTKWNTGELEEEGCPGQLYKDDVHFVRMMLDTIEQIFPIDQRRIYASGFSNGGVFVSKLAIEMSDVFAALTVAAGALHPRDSGAPARPIPFVYIVGNKDSHALERIGLPEIPFNDSAMMILSNVVNRYLPIFNLAPVYTKTETPGAIIWSYNTPATAAPSSEFRISLIRDMDHQYPNGNNHPAVAANVFWQFFKQFSLPSGVADERSSEGGITIYPNPARTYVTVTGAGTTRIVLRNLIGQPVLEQQTGPGATISIEGLPAGLYIMEMQTPKGVTTRMLRIE